MSTHGNILILAYDFLKLNVNDKLNIKQVERLEIENVLYIHSDGYPSHLLNWLIDFLNLEGAKARPHDNFYLLSWMATYFNIKIMSKYLNNKATQYREFLNDKITIEEFNKNLYNYKFNVDDFKNLKDFRGSGIYNFDVIDSSYNYIVAPASFEPCDNEYIFNIYVLDDSFKVLYILNERTSKEIIKGLE